MMLPFAFGLLSSKIFLAGIILIGYIIYFYWRVGKYPKGPFPYPFVGNALQLNLPTLHLDYERYREIYGDVFTIWIFGRPFVVLNREEAIREAFINNADVFTDRTGDFIEKLFQTTDNGGIIFSSGDNWREQRRAALHILRDFGLGKNVMEQQVHEQIEMFTEFVRNIEDKEAVNIDRPIQVMVANVISNILYGYSSSFTNCDRLMAYANAINSIFSEMVENIFVLVVQIFPPALHVPFIGYQAVGKYQDKYQRCIDFVKEDVKKALTDYSKEEEPNCVAQAYFQKIDKNDALDMENMYNVCADFFMAGMETTSNTLRWALLYLTKNRDIQQKLRKEVSEIVGFNRLPSLKDRQSMPYTNAVIAEVQRCANIISLSLQRKTSQDVKIRGEIIPGGTVVQPQWYGCHVDDRHFPEAEKFKPERFLNDDGTLNTDLLSRLIIFGAGKRQCAGESLARAEIFLSLTSIIQRFELFPQEGAEIDLTRGHGVIVPPKQNYLRIVEIHNN